MLCVPGPFEAPRKDLVESLGPGSSPVVSPPTTGKEDLWTHSFESHNECFTIHFLSYQERMTSGSWSEARRLEGRKHDGPHHQLEAFNIRFV